MNSATKKVFIEKANALKPMLKETMIAPMRKTDTKVLHTGDSVVYDFGNHYVGYLRFHCKTAGSHYDAPAFLKIKFCEALRELQEDSADYQGWISKSWIQEEWIHIDDFPSEIFLPRRYAFRYVKIEVLDVSSKYGLVIDDITATAVTSADEGKIPPFSGTEIETAIDQAAIRTLQNCMQDVFEDGPKRDRRLWIGDLHLQALANQATFQDYDLVKRCLYLFAGTANEEGRISACVFTKPTDEADDTYMFDYSLFFISTLCDYVEMTQDLETGSELLSVAVTQWELALQNFDENHLMIDSDRLGWCFLDWNLNLNKQTGAQAVHIFCAKKLVKLMEILKETELVAAVHQDIEKKVQAAKTYLYDSTLGLFISGAERQISYASQVWAVLAGIFDDQKNEKIMEELEKHTEAVYMVTPYMHHFYIEALLKIGKREQAYDAMIGYWGAMIQDGAQTFYELFNPENPNESPYGSSIVNSYCHAWSCTPSYFMRVRGLVKK